MEKSILEELRDWENQYRGHEDLLENDLNEINNFVDDPMYVNMTDVQKEQMKANLVHFLKQVC